jgi:hypothetical protein
MITIILKIRLVKEREVIGGILVKNGYRVKQISVKKKEGKGNDICLEFESGNGNFKVRDAREREYISGILIKNGYQVQYVKPEGSRIVFIEAAEPESMVGSSERMNEDE